MRKAKILATLGLASDTQAMVESMTLITQDEAFATVRGIRTLW